MIFFFRVFKQVVEDEKFISLNDVAAFDEERFFVTNDHGYIRNSIMFIISTIIPRLSTSSVVFWDGFQSHYAAQPGDIKFPNGIVFNHKNSKLFISSTAPPGILYIFSVNDINHPENIEEFKQIIVSTGIDNLSISPDDGSLWAACHPNSLRFLNHALRPKTTIAPSQVLRFDISNLDNISVSQKFISDGEEVSASATGLSIGDYLVITPVFSDHFLICTR